MKKKIAIIIVTILFILLPTSCSGNSSGNVPSLNVLFEKNKIDVLLSEYENVTIDATYTSEDTTSSYSKYLYEINDNVVFDSIYETEDLIQLQSSRDNVIYFVENDLYELNVYEEIQNSLGYFDSVKEPKQIGKVREVNDSWLLFFWYEEDNSKYYCSVWFDKTTLQAEKMTIALFNDTPLGVIEIEFKYNSADLGLDTTAYDLHTTGVDEITVDFVFNYLTSNPTNVTVNTVKSSKINVYNNEYEKYSAYLGITDLEGINELAEIENNTTLYVLETKPKISFECSFTNEVAANIEAALDEFKQTGLSSDKNAFDLAFEKMDYYFMFISGQDLNHLIEYYNNPNSQTSDAYLFVYNFYDEVYIKYNEILVELISSSPIKDYIVSKYTEEYIAQLQKDNAAICELGLKEEELVIKYQSLDPKSPNWQDEADTINIELAKVRHQMAVLEGYDNYYDYQINSIYKLDYSQEDKENLRKFVIEYIVPLYNETTNMKKYYYNELTNKEEDEYRKYTAGRLSHYISLYQYIYDYIDTYKGYDVYDIMMSAFEDNAIVVSDNKNSLGTAFCYWNPFYQHSVIYLSYNHNDIYGNIHELGHYTAKYHYDVYNLSKDVAEIHSISNEVLLTYYLKYLIVPKLWKTIKFNLIEDNLWTIIVGVYSDEFEEKFYKGIAENENFTVEDMRAILDEVNKKYLTALKSEEEYINRKIIRTFLIANPVYYICYATSSISSFSYMYITETEGYDVAQAKYVELLSEVDASLSYKEIVNELGLFNPFVEETYIKLKDIID